ncbi:probable E3 ubiquitin-protein ligase MARCHF10 isoform X6 [Chrysemys picta bellii]|uniref:probable E3 ubiquitin-protein ligase MARCHF10 isoform X6 n=1 Tax=Chrysemys picta bellii TaxID=8478 RepID=UPI0032B21625
MYDSRERQKFISDAQYVREMQHKMDSEYQACLRRQEQNREQTEKKREQHARQEQRQKTLSSIYATRSYERPWISGIPVTRQTSADEGSGSAIKSSANRSDSKFPAIEKTSSKQKQKPPMSSSKVTPAAQKQSLLRRKRMNQGGLLGSPDTQNLRKLEDRDRQASLLQAKAQVTSASGAELGAVKTCELCKQSLIADLDDFDVNDYYRNHQQSRAQSELMNSGLYLVLLLHLYEQRFAELMRLNYNQASRDRIQSRGTMDRRVLPRLSNEFGKEAFILNTLLHVFYILFFWSCFTPN